MYQDLPRGWQECSSPSLDRLNLHNFRSIINRQQVSTRRRPLRCRPITNSSLPSLHTPSHIPTPYSTPNIPVLYTEHPEGSYTGHRTRYTESQGLKGMHSLSRCICTTPQDMGHPLGDPCHRNQRCFQLKDPSRLSRPSESRAQTPRPDLDQDTQNGSRIS